MGRWDFSTLLTFVASLALHFGIAFADRGGERGVTPSGNYGGKATHVPARNAPPAVDVPFGNMGKYVTAGITRTTMSDFFQSIAKAREKIAQSVKNVFRPHVKVNKPTTTKMMEALYDPAGKWL